MDTSSPTTLYEHCDHHLAGDTGISYLLKNNKPPMPSDISTIYHAISKAQSKLSNIDRQVSQAIAVLDDLQSKQNQGEQHLKNLKGIIHPIRRIPPELLAAIFILTIPQPWQIASRSQLYTYRKAVSLPGQVCNVWRDISLSTPQLWSKIIVDISRNNESNAEHALVDTWLSRTGECPLSIEIFGEPGPVKPTITKALIASSPRWRYLLLPGSLFWLQSGALGELRHRLPQLQTLVYDTRNTYPIGRSSRVPLSPTSLFVHTPQLRSCHFHSRIPVQDLPLILPWSQLEEFSAEHIALQNSYTILSKAENLVTCSLSQIVFEDPVTLPLLSHSHLQFLSIELHTYSGDLLGHLTLPALSQLQYTEIYSPADNFSVSRSVLVACLSRSMCSLKRLILKLDPTHTTDDYIIQILRLLPSLSELQLMPNASDDLLLQLTHRTSDSDSVIPSLHTIELSLTRASGVLSLRLADVIESRWNVGDVVIESTRGPITCLKHVRVTLDQSINSKAVVKRLRKLCKKGLDIRFEFTTR